jgi:hypothetical protein
MSFVPDPGDVEIRDQMTSELAIKATGYYNPGKQKGMMHG